MRVKRGSMIYIIFYDPFTEKELGTISHSYDPEMMSNGYYRLIAVAWIKTFSGVLRRSGKLKSRIRFKISFL